MKKRGATSSIVARGSNSLDKQGYRFGPGSKLNANNRTPITAGTNAITVTTTTQHPSYRQQLHSTALNSETPFSAKHQHLSTDTNTQAQAPNTTTNTTRNTPKTNTNQRRHQHDQHQHQHQHDQQQYQQQNPRGHRLAGGTVDEGSEDTSGLASLGGLSAMCPSRQTVVTWRRMRRKFFLATHLRSTGRPTFMRRKVLHKQQPEL